MPDSAPRLYLVTAQGFDPGALAETLGTILATDTVACVRLDLGQAAEERWIEAANHLMPVCHAADVPLVIADHHRLVAPLGLDGVHLIRSRSPVREVRKALGKDRIVGADGGTERHRAMSIAEAGADYVTLGPVSAAGALGDGGIATRELFEWWSEMIETPSVAEGGVGPVEAAALGRVVDFIVPDPAAIWDAPDPAEAARAFAAALGD
jgi:thiamine-phosphate pyrophosphorylase